MPAVTSDSTSDATSDRQPADEPELLSPARKRDAEETRRNILAVAKEEFAKNGLSGARVDAIAARTRTTKRMIYYYFGSKEGLYLAVLEKAYADIRGIEINLHLEEADPETAIRTLIDFTIDYQDANPDFIRLVSIENIHEGRFIAQSEAIRNLNVAIIDTIRRILARGRETGAFRDDVDPVDVHLMISSFSFFRVSNRHTFGTIFKRDLSDPELKERHKRMLAEAVIRLLRPA
ncbi:TetR family transcriptional regulator [Azospirillum sp. SYSU D00513]|uniref:TetR family transcriptional regulator n=1 Tax=Azospirillum sp. SYSU D00513 TaxID=2812561 RepID=UPI001A96A8C5|nr:TetR family transcriptional regulator [Azospirillum sp. SYSU D00513]